MHFQNTIGTGWKILAACLTICGSIISGVTYFHDIGGELSATINGNILENNETKNFIVFMDSNNISSCFSVPCPTFTNSSNYSIRDFYLKYQLNSTGVQFIPSDYYRMYNEGNNLYTLRYDENVLPGFKNVENPIKETIVSQNGGNMILKVEATYDGCSKPYVCTFNILYVIVPNDKHLDFQHWKQKCLKSYPSAISKPNIFLTGKGYVEYTDNINLSTKQSNNIQNNIKQEKSEIISQTDRHNYNPDSAKDRRSLSDIHSNSGLNSNRISMDEKSEPAGPSEISCSKNNKINTNFILSVKQCDESHIEFLTSNLYPDSIFLICIRNECIINQKVVNDVLLIKGSETQKKLIYPLCNTNLKYIDYAICEENPNLADSIDIDKNENKISNNTRHTVAVGIVLNDGYSVHLLAPYKSLTISPKFVNSAYFRYYNVPQYILSDEYAPLLLLPKYDDVKQVLSWGLLLLLISIIVVVLLGGVVVAYDEGFNSIIKQLQSLTVSDIMVFIKYIILFSFAVASYLIIVTILVNFLYYFNII